MNGLGAVEQRFLDEQRARADDVVTAARQEAYQLLKNAQADAAAMTASAAREGELSADADTNREWTAARRRARANVLTARREIYEDLVARCATSIRTDDRYAEAQRVISHESLKRLGPGAQVAIDEDTVTVTRKQRRIRWSLESAVSAALSQLGAELEAIYR
ncbi:MAG TPA: hypothetical protein VFK22_07545 [Candidatus Dormibacteraeota bacterium]|nr:hypothetical protein [Candidatus Dormibacteraeota bacterium]